MIKLQNRKLVVAKADIKLNDMEITDGSTYELRKNELSGSPLWYVTQPNVGFIGNVYWDDGEVFSLLPLFDEVQPRKRVPLVKGLHVKFISGPNKGTAGRLQRNSLVSHELWYVLLPSGRPVNVFSSNRAHPKNDMGQLEVA